MLLRLFFIFATLFIGMRGQMFDQIMYMDTPLNGSNANVNFSNSQCYHFTWLNEDDQSFKPFLNKSCSEVFATTRPMPVCVDPLVATNNATEPAWGNLYPNSNLLPYLLCHPQKGEVCAKYSLFFNGAVQNVTRYCTKVTVNDQPMKSGCIRDTRGAYISEICVCDSEIGMSPCNSAMPNAPQSFSILISFLILITYATFNTLVIPVC